MLNTYLKFYRFLLAYKWQYALFTGVLVLYSVADSIQPYFYKLFVDAIPEGNYQRLVNILFLYMGVRLLFVVFDLATFWIGDYVLFNAARDARVAVFKKIQDLDFAFHLSKSTGSLISAMKRGDGAFFSLFHALNINLTRILINLVVVLVFLNTVTWEISALMGVTFLLNLVFAYFLVKFNVRKRKEFNDAEDKISAVIVDNMINYETVKLFAKENWEQQRLQHTFKDWLTKLWGYGNSFRAIDVTVGIAGNLGLFLILMFSLRQTANFNFSVGEFVLILGFVTNFYPKFYDLIFRFREMAKNYADLYKYFAILDEHTLISDPDNPLKKSIVNGEIEFKNVTFTYPEAKRPALKNFDLIIRQGQSVAFVGTSGVGKTTVMKLLMRFYDVDKGEILIDGINIKRFTKSQLRSFMGVVPQEPILFNNSVKFNIAYGAGGTASQKIIEAATKMANLDEFVDHLPEKYQTQVGERGIKLSGGQKQRLAIARMILVRPQIIIFDEATSHLDSESEKKIQEAFWKASQDKTTIIIAHRLSTITRADQIVVMRHGRVHEQGSHHDLINRPDSLYNRFWRLQTGKG